MGQTTETRTSPGEKIVKDIKRATRKHYSSEEKIRIVEGINPNLYYRWSKDFLEASKKRIQEDTVRIIIHRKNWKKRFPPSWSITIIIGITSL